jgi:uncharacterized protein (DUF2252 family)
MAKKAKENNALTLKAIIEDEKMFDRLCQFIIELSRRQKNLVISKKELSDSQTAFKKELGLTKGNFDQVLAYAQSMMSNQNLENNDKDLIKISTEAAEAIAQRASSDKELYRALVN